MVAIKGAIISTGVGLAVVAIGEGISYIYRQLSGAPAAPAGGEHDQEARTRAGDRVRKGQFLDNEWRAYEEGMKNANTETDVDAVGNRILNNLRRAEEELEYVAKTAGRRIGGMEGSGRRGGEPDGSLHPLSIVP